MSRIQLLSASLPLTAPAFTSKAVLPSGDFLAAALKSLFTLGSLSAARPPGLGTPGDDIIKITATFSGSMSLGAGNDRLTNLGTITGKIDLGDGADHYNGRLAKALATVDGGSGNDVLWGATKVPTRLFGGDGHDQLFGGNAADLLSGGAGNDVINAGGGHDTLDGGTGNDHLFGGAGNDLLTGGNGHDRLLGEAGNDRLFGGEGNDTLNGGSGNDALTGGAGADTFVFARRGGADVVTDFDHTLDLLRFEGLGTVTQVMSRAREIGPDVLFDFGRGDQLMIKNAALDDLHGLLIG